jgi:hypothetical protein
MKLPNPPYSKLERRLITLKTQLQSTLAAVEGKLAQLALANWRTHV